MTDQYSRATTTTITSKQYDDDCTVTFRGIFFVRCDHFSWARSTYAECVYIWRYDLSVSAYNMCIVIIVWCNLLWFDRFSYSFYCCCRFHVRILWTDPSRLHFIYLVSFSFSQLDPLCLTHASIPSSSLNSLILGRKDSSRATIRTAHIASASGFTVNGERKKSWPQPNRVIDKSSLRRSGHLATYWNCF